MRLGDAKTLDEMMARRPLEGHYYTPEKHESPIEDICAWQLVKYVHPKASFVPQCWVTVHTGERFRLDFFIRRGGRAIAIECDGKAHDVERDLRRDTLLLESGSVAALYRLRGRDIYRHLDDLLYLICEHEQGLFSDQAKVNLPVLASREVRDLEVLRHDAGHWVEYQQNDEDDAERAHIPDNLLLIRRASENIGWWRSAA